MDDYEQPMIEEIATIADLTRGEWFSDGSDDMFPSKFLNKLFDPLTGS